MSFGLFAQDYSYTVKLYGTQRSFTPDSEELMIRFRAEAVQSLNSSEALGRAVELDGVFDETVTTDRFGIYQFNGSQDELNRLREKPEVQSVMRAMTDEVGLKTYFLPDEIALQLRPGLSPQMMEATIRAEGFEVVETTRIEGLYTVRIPEDRELFESIRAWNRNDDALFAEPVFYNFDMYDFVPNDTFFSTSWHLENDGTNATGATVDADIDASSAWDIEQGDRRVLVVVIDSGVDWDHEDLQNSTAQNLGEDADGDGQVFTCVGSVCTIDAGDINGVDDDGNGQVDDFVGWDFVNGDNDPHPGTSAHGTACAGIIAAQANNNLGVAGIANGVSVMGLRHSNSIQSANALNYAASFLTNAAAGYEGVIVSASWNYGSGNATVTTAVNNARTAGVLPIFSASNDNTSPIYSPGILSTTMGVAATSPCDTRKRSSSNPAQVNPGVSTDPLGTSCDGEDWWGSNFGSNLSIAAPGVLIPTTDMTGGGGYTPNDYVTTFNGTSAATPVVAGVAALVMSHHLDLSPGDPMITADEVQDILETSADEVGGYVYTNGFSNDLGAGRVNALKALQELIIRKVDAIQPTPVDIALAIDRSGSMGPPLADIEKFEAAQNAARQIVRLMNNGDFVSVVSYSNTATVDYSMNEIMSNTDRDDAIAAVDGLSHGGGTSIGDAIDVSHSEHNSPGQSPTTILMTDGKNTSSPTPSQILNTMAISETIHTIGFGAPGDVNEDTLNHIADETGGTYFYAGADGFLSPIRIDTPAGLDRPVASAFGTSGGLTLIKAYQTSFQEASQRKILLMEDDFSFGQSVQKEVFIDSAVDEVRFNLFWDLNQAKAFQLFLVNPNGDVIDPKEASNNPLMEYVEDETLGSYVVKAPMKGLWKLIASGESDGQLHFVVAAYTRCELVLKLTNHAANLPLLVEATLYDNGFPVGKQGVQARIHLPTGQFFEVELNDEGRNGDKVESDGTYSFELLEVFGEPGSYTVEAIAQGKDREGIPFVRYDVASIHASPRKNLDVRLPEIIYPAGITFDLPILVNKFVHPLDPVTKFDLSVAYDPSVLKATGKVTLRNTMADGAKCEVGVKEDNVRLVCNGEITGDGVLAYLGFQTNPDAPDGAETPLKGFDVDFTTDSGVGASVTDGSFRIGDTFIDEGKGVSWNAGWNLGCFGTDADTKFDGTFASFISAFGYDAKDGYFPISSASPGQGFWLNLETDETANALGNPLGAFGTETGNPGWSLIGCTGGTSSTVNAKNAGNLKSVFYFDPDKGYVPAEDNTYPANHAVWVNCEESCNLTVEPANGKFAKTDDVVSDAPTGITLLATGQRREASATQASVVIGLGASDRIVAYPPAIPSATTSMTLSRAGQPGPLYSDIRSSSSDRVMWTLEIDPNGTASEEMETVVSWSAADLAAAADQVWTLRRGTDGFGEIMVEDMRETPRFRVTGTEPQTYTITLEQVVLGGEQGVIPDAFALQTNYPNPFNPTTTIRYDVSEQSNVTLKVYDVSGRLVRTLVETSVQPGRYTATWDGRSAAGAAVSSGVYFYRLRAGGFDATRRMVLLK